MRAYGGKWKHRGGARACNDHGRCVDAHRSCSVRCGSRCRRRRTAGPSASSLRSSRTGVVDAGHDVTLFASGDSQTRARLESVFHTAPSEWIGHTYWEMEHSADQLHIAVTRRPHGDARARTRRSWAIETPCCSLRARPGSTGQPRPKIIDLSAPNAKLISISMNQRKPKENLPWIANCPNALDLSMFPFRRKPGRFPPADEPGQGRTTSAGRRPRDRPSAEDRRQ